MGTVDLQRIDYNNDTPIDDLETVDFNNDTEMSDLIDLKEISGTKEAEFVKQVPLHPRERLKKPRKAELNNYSQLSKKSKNDITFIRQVPMYPRNRLKKLVAIKEKVKFIKRVPVHLRNRLKRKTKNIIQIPAYPRDKLRKTTNKPKHLRNRMKNIEGKIGRQNVSKLMRGEFNFNPKKTLIFDTTKINEEIIIDKIIEALNDKTNKEFYIEHSPGPTYFTLKPEDGR